MESVYLQVILPVVLGTICMGFMGIMKRLIMKPKLVSPLQCLILFFFGATVLFGFVYVVLWGFTLPEVLPGFWTAVAIGSAANVLIQFFNVKAASLDAGEVSLTAPLQAMTPGLVTLMAITLGEFPSKLAVLGICLMAVGSYVILFEKNPTRIYQYFGPLGRVGMLFKLNSLSEIDRSKAQVVAMAFGSALLGTATLLFGGLCIRKGQNMQGLVFTGALLVFTLSISYSLIYLVKPDKQPKQSFGNGFIKTTPILILLIAILWVAHVLLIDQTYTKTLVAYVGSLKRSSVIIGVLLSRVFFKEQQFKQRIIASILIVIGAILISTDDLPAKLSTHLEAFGF